MPGATQPNAAGAAPAASAPAGAGGGWLGMPQQNPHAAAGQGGADAFAYYHLRQRRSRIADQGFGPPGEFCSQRHKPTALEVPFLCILPRTAGVVHLWGRDRRGGAGGNPQPGRTAPGQPATGFEGPSAPHTGVARTRCRLIRRKSHEFSCPTAPCSQIVAQRDSTVSLSLAWLIRLKRAPAGS